MEVVSFVKPLFKTADYPIINLETPVTDNPATPHLIKGYAFYSLPETLPALTSLGIKYVCLGNNHTYDYLEQGVLDTIKNLTSDDARAVRLFIYHERHPDETEGLIGVDDLHLISWEAQEAEVELGTKKLIPNTFDLFSDNTFSTSNPMDFLRVAGPPGDYELHVIFHKYMPSFEGYRVPWDVNSDGMVNLFDLVLVALDFGKIGQGLATDINHDGEVNVLDIIIVVWYFGEIIDINESST